MGTRTFFRMHRLSNMQVPIHKIVCVPIFILAATLPQAAAQTAAAYPTKPVRLIVASGAGGGLDFVARQVAVPLSEALGQTVVVDNRAGASGSIAAEVSSQAAPDGYARRSSTR